MYASYSARFQHSQQIRRQIVHLLKELVVVLIMPEVVIGRSVLIVVGERDAGYNQVEAASVLKVTQPRVSNLMNGKISKFSIDMLIEMLGRLGYLMDVSFDLSSKENPISVIVKKSAV